MIDLNLLIALATGVVVGVPVGMLLWNLVLARSARSLRAIEDRSRHDAHALIAAAERDAAVLREGTVVAARAEALALKEEATREVERRRDEIEKAERRLGDREAQLSERQDRVRGDERTVEQSQTALIEREKALGQTQADLGRLESEIQLRLERAAGLTAEEAAREVRQQVEDEARTQAAASARDIKERARRDADRDARRLLAMTTQRLASEYTAESTVSAVSLPNDEMKGRIIGREGRNIRAFELATGVDVIIDDTPDTVVISCFDPVRREIARRALDALVADGRIHPGRIEEVVVKAQKELDAQLTELGERAAYDVGVNGLHPELIRLVGRMRYRSSYGQNLYEHSKEVSWLAGMMAAELHVDVALARRGGLLHDIGKVLTHDHEGTHVQLGVEVCRRHGESEAVLNCIEAHHDDVAHESTESVLVQASDSVSGSRPGARREAFETYVKRLTKLEEIAGGYPGVEKTTVIQAGREVRVIVQPERVDDNAAQALSETIARRIEQELQYPGQIRVTVIRETRATDVAK